MITNMLRVYNINEKQFLSLFDEIDNKYRDIYEETVEWLVSDTDECEEYKVKVGIMEQQLSEYIDGLFEINDGDTDNEELIKINKEIEELNRQLIENKKARLGIDLASERLVLLENNVELLEQKLTMIVSDIINMNEEVIS